LRATNEGATSRCLFDFGFHGRHGRGGRRGGGRYGRYGRYGRRRWRRGFRRFGRRRRLDQRRVRAEYRAAERLIEHGGLCREVRFRLRVVLLRGVQGVLRLITEL